MDLKIFNYEEMENEMHNILYGLIKGCQNGFYNLEGLEEIRHIQ